jgi:hypothetical protein
MAFDSDLHNNLLLGQTGLAGPDGTADIATVPLSCLGFKRSTGFDRVFALVFPDQSDMPSNSAQSATIVR